MVSAGNYGKKLNPSSITDKNESVQSFWKIAWPFLKKILVISFLNI